MKRLNILSALAATAVLFSASAGADDRGHRGWDRDHYSRDYRHHGRSDRYHRYDGRWDDRRYIHTRSDRYWAPRGHYYRNDYRGGYGGNRYYGDYYGNYYGNYYGSYYPPHYRRSGIDATVVLTFPIW
jgi:hypothetical protein